LSRTRGKTNVLAEVGGGEGEDGRVDDRLAEEHDEHSREGGRTSGDEGNDQGEDAAQRPVCHDGKGRVNEADDRDGDEARDHETDLHCEGEGE
jgi:hypothetical protein